MNEPADAVSCRGTAEPVHQAAVLRPCCRPAAGTRMKTIPPARGKRPAASAARTSAPSSGKSGRSISRAPATAVRLAFVSARTRSTRSIPLSRDFRTTRRASAWASVRRVSCSMATVSARSETVWSHARWSRASPIGYFRAHAEAWTKPSAECADQADMAGIPERISTRKCPHRQVQADHRAESRRDHDVQPRSEPALNATQLRWRNAGCPSDGCQGQGGSGAGRAQLRTEISEQPPAAAGTTGRVRLGHRHILTERPHQPINRAATIGP